MGKVDTSDLIIIIRWVKDISSRSPKLELASLTHTTPHTAKKIKKATERNDYILNTLSAKYTQQALTHHEVTLEWYVNIKLKLLK